MKPAASKSALEVRSDLSTINPLLFLGVCLLSFISIVWLPESLFAPLNRVTAYLSGLCIGLFGGKAGIAGDVISLDGFRVRIITECTALYSSILFAAFVLAWPATWRQRAIGLLAGSVIISSANLFRIAAVTVVGSKYPSVFEAFHVYLGQVLMLLMVIGLAMAWRRWAAGLPRGDASFLPRAFILAALLFPVWLACNRAYVMATDRMVTALFALFHHEILIPHQELLYFHTFNMVLLATLLGADQRLPVRRRLLFALAGGAVLVAEHILYRIGNAFLTAFGWEPAFQFTIAIALCGEYLLPVLFWLWASRDPSGKSGLIAIKEKMNRQQKIAVP